MNALTDDQQLLHDEIVRRAATEARGDQAGFLASYARAGFDPGDIEAVRASLFGPYRPTSRDAAWSLVFGLTSLLICPLPGVGILAILCTRRALKDTRTGIKSGEGMAIAGAMLGALSTVLTTVTFVALALGG